MVLVSEFLLAEFVLPARHLVFFLAPELQQLPLSVPHEVLPVPVDEVLWLGRSKTLRLKGLLALQFSIQHFENVSLQTILNSFLLFLLFSFFRELPVSAFCFFFVDFYLHCAALFGYQANVQNLILHEALLTAKKLDLPLVLRMLLAVCD